MMLISVQIVCKVYVISTLCLVTDDWWWWPDTKACIMLTSSVVKCRYVCVHIAIYKHRFICLYTVSRNKLHPFIFVITLELSYNSIIFGGQMSKWVCSNVMTKISVFPFDVSTLPCEGNVWKSLHNQFKVCLKAQTVDKLCIYTSQQMFTYGQGRLSPLSHGQVHFPFHFPFSLAFHGPSLNPAKRTVGKL